MYDATRMDGTEMGGSGFPLMPEEIDRPESDGTVEWSCEQEEAVDISDEVFEKPGKEHHKQRIRGTAKAKANLVRNAEIARKSMRSREQSDDQSHLIRTVSYVYGSDTTTVYVDGSRTARALRIMKAAEKIGR